MAFKGPVQSKPFYDFIIALQTALHLLQQVPVLVPQPGRQPEVREIPDQGKHFYSLDRVMKAAPMGSKIIGLNIHYSNTTKKGIKQSCAQTKL